jgi:hypothetical protein
MFVVAANSFLSQARYAVKHAMFEQALKVNSLLIGDDLHS